jgi:hypothetical protein
MISKFPFTLDPLDRELLEMDGVRANTGCVSHESESCADAELEAMLQAELIEIARTNGVEDSETLRRTFVRGRELRCGGQLSLQQSGGGGPAPGQRHDQRVNTCTSAEQSISLPPKRSA